MDKKDKSRGWGGVSYLSMLSGLGGSVPIRKPKLWERIRDALEGVNADWEFDRQKPAITQAMVRETARWWFDEPAVIPEEAWARVPHESGGGAGRPRPQHSTG